jgi:hypothetical protein
VATGDGYASGFPTFQREDDQMRCVIVDSDQAEIRDVPADELILDQSLE